ncbi:MAG: hypothetical protein ABH858_03050 [Candidatus Omnitrophota bacterium]
MENKNPPLGVLIFARLNCFVVGGLFLLIFLLSYFTVTVDNFDEIKKLIEEKGFFMPMNYAQFKTAVIVNSFVALWFIISGVGLLFKKEWARKGTVYFSFVWTAFIFMAALISPSLIHRLFIQIVYPGMMGFYFTSRKVAQYFSPEEKKLPPNCPDSV